MKQRCATVLGICFLLVLLTGNEALAETDSESPATTQPGGSRATRPTAALPPAISQAIAALEEEYQAFARGQGELRRSSDYFARNPSDLTPEQVLQALSRRLSRDPQADVYIKWQLMSAVQSTFDSGLALRALDLYTRAPAPPPRPGSTQAHQRELDQLLRGASRDDQDSIARKWNEVFARQMEASRPALAYRDELFRRLPASLATLQAGFADLHERLRLGYDTRFLLDQLVVATRGWMYLDAKPQELNALASQLNRLLNERGPAYYDTLEWNEKSRRLEWRRRTEAINRRTLEPLIRDLNQAARGAGPQFD